MDILFSILIHSIPYIIGGVIAYLGSYFSYRFDKKLQEKHHQKYKQALLRIFKICVDDCIRFIIYQSTMGENKPWASELWNRIQLEIAKEFPSEFLTFITILERRINFISDDATSFRDLEGLQQKIESLIEP